VRRNLDILRQPERPWTEPESISSSCKIETKGVLQQPKPRNVTKMKSAANTDVGPSPTECSAGAPGTQRVTGLELVARMARVVAKS
jgi:hypothetical protein